MTKLMAYVCSFSASQLDSQVSQNVISVIGADFCKTYHVSGSQVKIEIAEAETKRWDVVVAYDTLPNIANAMSSKLNQFRDMVADDLFSVLPTELGYGGKVAIRNINTIVNASKAEKYQKQSRESDEDEEMDTAYEKMAEQFQAEEPKFTFDQLVLENGVRERLLEAVSLLENREKLFDEWNLKAIMSPSVLLNLYGASGTGKSMTAEALADRLGKKVIRASYADIESKYHGEGPKRMKAIFLAAKQQDAVLFIDEADSMLSARLTNVSQGSEQAINSMRSQLLISLENHDGIVIFATNLIENYDQAFLTRLICIEMNRPNREARNKIWYNHLYPVGNDEKTLKIPLAEDIDLGRLSDYDFCGRDIRNAVKQACISTVMKGKDVVDQGALLSACKRINCELEGLQKAVGRVGKAKIKSMAEDEKEKLIESAAESLKRKKDADIQNS